MQLNSSSPSPAGLGAAPYTPKPVVEVGVLAWGSVPCRAWLGGLDSGQQRRGLERSHAQSQLGFPTKQGLCWCKSPPFLSEMQFLCYSYKPACREREVTRASDTMYGFIFFFPCTFAFYRPQIKGSGESGAAAIKAPSHWRSVFLKKWGIAACSRNMGGLMQNICINKIWKEENLFPTVNYLIGCLFKLH